VTDSVAKEDDTGVSTRMVGLGIGGGEFGVLVVEILVQQLLARHWTSFAQQALFGVH
jgi:hypothetical protein